MSTQMCLPQRRLPWRGLKRDRNVATSLCHCHNIRREDNAVSICRTANTQASELNPLTPNDHYRGRTAPLTSKRCILYIYSTNIGTEYFKHTTYSPFLPLQNAVCFIILTYLVPVLFTFYIFIQQI